MTVTETLKAVVCSRNRHKVAELADLLPSFTMRPLPDDVTVPPEDGATFVDNALIKARAGTAVAERDEWSIADDSGLCVDALQGAPGVHSARFAGPEASDDDNNALLLESLEHYPHDAERRARFRCALVAIAPDGRELVAEGAVEGHITHQPTGDHGFGYDPLFVPDGHDGTFGELGPAVKDQFSHRARAAESLLRQIEDSLST